MLEGSHLVKILHWIGLLFSLSFIEACGHGSWDKTIKKTEEETN